jgi:hypothetical protein
MSVALTTQRYAYEPNHDGTYSVTDSLTGECVGTTADEREARKTTQRMNALHLANVNRIGRAAIRREIHAVPSQEGGRETCAAVLEDNPPAIASMRVDALLRAVRWHGPARRQATLKFAGCSSVKVVQDLTARQRARLCEALRMSTDELRVEALGLRGAP